MLRLLLELKDNGRRVVIRSIWWSKETKSISVQLSRAVTFKEGGSYRLSHILWWLKTGRRIPEGKVIHHVDHDPRNTLVENYLVMTRAAHASHHHLGRSLSKEHRSKITSAARRRGKTPEFRKIASDRAKRQHKEKTFGAHTWKHRHYPNHFLASFSNVIPKQAKNETYLVHIIRNRCDGKRRHQSVCGQVPMRSFDVSERKWKVTKDKPTCERCLAYLAREN